MPSKTGGGGVGGFGVPARKVRVKMLTAITTSSQRPGLGRKKRTGETEERRVGRSERVSNESTEGFNCRSAEIEVLRGKDLP